ncbi:hypothetical protein B0J14DRAFT_611394 [Halenospora varia]|nr:hypothetical protein B0J14DRAFT_611394 [Halenospora varia]
MKGPIAIIGAGTQGRRLAYMWSSRGGRVNLIDPKQSALQSAAREINKFTRTVGKSSGHQNGLVTTFGSEDMKSALSGAWLVVENVPESLELKRSVLAQLDEMADPDTVLASNSSSFTIGEIMNELRLKHESRCISLHSYWPPETPAIELMGTDITEPGVISMMMRECKAHGFSPFHVKRPSRGYIYNRIWAAIKRESLYVAAEGIATPAEIDAIYKDVLKTPVGPFEQMDLVGLDVVRDIEDVYARNREGLPVEPRRLLGEMIGDGKLGVKTGEGFYKY